MKMPTCWMSVSLEQTDGPTTGEVPPLPHPGRSTAATSTAAAAAPTPILNSSRRVTFLAGMGRFISASFHCSLRWIGEAEAPRQLHNPLFRDSLVGSAIWHAHVTVTPLVLPLLEAAWTDNR